MESFADRLRSIRAEKDMTLDEFARLLGTSKQVLSRYETGVRAPKITTVQEYAAKLGVQLNYLLPGISGERNSVKQSENMLPILGIIKAGLPIFAEENYEGEIDTGELEGDFVVQVSGDSMVYAGIYENDYVVLEQAETAHSGQIVAALIGDDDSSASDATLKYYIAQPNGRAILRAANPAYPDIPLRGRIIGVFNGLIRSEEPRLREVEHIEYNADRFSEEWLDFVAEMQAAGISAREAKAVFSAIRKVNSMKKE